MAFQELIRGLKTHCKNGHAYTPQNTSVRRDRDGSTYRACKACARAAWRKTKAKHGES